MTAPTLTIAVPTIGRAGLKTTLDSIARQALIPGDRVLVVLDTYQTSPRPDVVELVASYGSPFELHEHDGGTHYFGVPQYNYAMSLADTDFFCGLGDDDIYVDGAIERLRPQLQAGRAALLQFLSPPFPAVGGERRFVLWDEPILRVSHISGCCLVAPVSCLVPLGDDRRIEVDFDWIEAVVAKTEQPPVWIADCLIIARPDVRNGETVHRGVTTCKACRAVQYLEDVDDTGRCPRCIRRPAVPSRLRLLYVRPGASWSTADVATGLAHGLKQHGVELVEYALDTRIARSQSWLYYNWRQTKKHRPDVQKPNVADVFFQAGGEALIMALWHDVFRGLDGVFLVSGMFVPLDIVMMMKRAQLPVFVLFTESPYDIHKELAMAKIVDGCWTNERSVVERFRAVNPNSGYLPHAWHPDRHRVGSQPDDEKVASHDVVFVGSAFHERVEWLKAIDWSGIDLGLYGSWECVSKSHPLKPFVKGKQIDNTATAALYRRAKIGLNLYRTSIGWGKHAQHIAHAESLNPRAYELAACGAFHLSTYREEVAEVFGDLVPTFTTSFEAEALIHSWLADPEGRARVASQLPACVAESSWATRATSIIGDLQTLLQQRAA